jgi:hypothetical protein
MRKFHAEQYFPKWQFTNLMMSFAMTYVTHHHHLSVSNLSTNSITFILESLHDKCCGLSVMPVGKVCLSLILVLLDCVKNSQ